MVFLSIFRRVAAEPSLLYASYAAVAIAMMLTTVMEIRIEGTSPKMFFGFKNSDLLSTFEQFGEDGRRTYATVGYVEYYFVIPACLVALGATLILAASRAGWSQDIAKIAPYMSILDIIATYGLQRACQVYPGSIWVYMADFASLCQQLRWVGMVVSAALIGGSYYIAEEKKKKSNKVA